MIQGDILITNVMGQENFIKRSERFQMLRKMGSDMRKALFNRYADLATEFSLSAHTPKEHVPPILALGIERFCSEKSQKGRFPWQTCVAALIWFIGTVR